MPTATKTSKILKGADTGPKTDSRAHPPPLPPVAAHARGLAPRSTPAMFAQARHELAEAVTASHPYDRYTGAHLAAIKAARTVVDARQMPVAPGRRQRPSTVWDLLYRSAPELADWAAYYAGGATRRAAALAGLPNAVTDAQAAELVRQTEVFLGVVAGMLGLPYQTGLPYEPGEQAAS